MKLSKKALWIIGTLITSAIAGIFFYLLKLPTPKRTMKP